MFCHSFRREGQKGLRRVSGPVAGRQQAGGGSVAASGGRPWNDEGQQGIPRDSGQQRVLLDARFHGLPRDGGPAAGRRHGGSRRRTDEERQGFFRDEGKQGLLQPRHPNLHPEAPGGFVDNVRIAFLIYISWLPRGIAFSDRVHRTQPQFYKANRN